MEEKKTVALPVAEQVKQTLAKAKKPGTMLGLAPSQIQQVFEAIKFQVAQAIPRHLTPERMIQVATNCVAKNPAIQECTPQSIMGSIVGLSVLGLNPALNEAYLVPFNKKVKNAKNEDVWIKECQLQIGYQGYMKLARQSGEIESISAHVVRKGDVFSYTYGLNETLEHIPCDNIEAEITHSYAVAKYKSGGYSFVVLTRKEIEALRKRSPNQKPGGKVSEEPVGIWATDYPAMACAKALKQLAKWMPKSDTLQTATQVDEGKIELNTIQDGEIDLNSVEYADYVDVETKEEKQELFHETENENKKKKQ